jgi:hypothetical protein
MKAADGKIGRAWQRAGVLRNNDGVRVPRFMIRALSVAISCLAACVLGAQVIPDTKAKLPSDVEIRQSLPGTWYFYFPATRLINTITIASNGDYVCQRVTPPPASFDGSHTSLTNKLEGTFEVKDGVLIDTLKKSSISNEPLPITFSNSIIRIDDKIFVYSNQQSGDETAYQKDVR